MGFGLMGGRTGPDWALLKRAGPLEDRARPPGAVRVAGLGPESWAVIIWLKRAWSHGGRQVELEVDSKIVSELILGACWSGPRIASLVEGIRTILEWEWSPPTVNVILVQAGWREIHCHYH
ncbi:hypothetical protein CRG98_037874 [Punica granatum]|uniref:RNase H type-1 domain-containing protein n=1 Tax=Punica granatum TaxID=22663 RepID=A0A2I0ICN1_PUNGR|nr:hypothetical protein CRG98_037874 [Punica granatum]